MPITETVTHDQATGTAGEVTLAGDQAAGTGERADLLQTLAN